MALISFVVFLPCPILELFAECVNVYILKSCNEQNTSIYMQAPTQIAQDKFFRKPVQGLFVKLNWIRYCQTQPSFKLDLSARVYLRGGLFLLLAIYKKIEKVNYRFPLNSY